MTRAGKWIRVSSAGQDEANQEPDIDRHCAEHGYDVVKRYQLHADSASKGEQQKTLDEVLDDIRRGEIQVLVCWHSDRLERRGVGATFQFIEAVRDAGGRTESVQEPYFGKLGDVSADAMTAINAIIAREKTDHLGKQVGLAHKRIRENGAVHGRAPWGMVIVGDKYNKALIGTDQGREWVPRIFAKVIEGWSLAKISLWLEAEGIPGDHGPWHESTIGAMIRNPAYMGFRCQQDPKTKKYGQILHKCEPLVSPAVWRQAQEALDTRPKRGYSDPDNRPMLSGVLKCGNPECDASGAPDSPMVRSRSSTKFYYRCRGLGAVPKSCSLMVPLADVDNAVDRIIQGSFDIPRMERRVIPGTDHAAERESLKFELRQLPARDLPWDEEDAERARLRAEYDRIAELPVVPDQVIEVDTGTTYANLWESLRPADRAEWLRREGFTVRASKTEVTVKQGDRLVTVSLDEIER